MKKINKLRFKMNRFIKSKKIIRKKYKNFMINYHRKYKNNLTKKVK